MKNLIKEFEVIKKERKETILITYEETHKMISTIEVLIPLMINFIKNNTNLTYHCFETYTNKKNQYF
jgi:hypothetical protein